MNSVTPVEKIRIAIGDQLSEFGAQRGELLTAASLKETILIRNGIFCGRKFQQADYVVVWFIEEDEIKFFDPSGEMIKATSAIGFLQEHEARTSNAERRAA
jgi:hypothetical protein